MRFTDSLQTTAIEFKVEHALATFGVDEHQKILSQLCSTCGERLMRVSDGYENSFPPYTNNGELLFRAFDIKVYEDDSETCPPKFWHKCYKLAPRGDAQIDIIRFVLL